MRVRNVPGKMRNAALSAASTVQFEVSVSNPGPGGGPAQVDPQAGQLTPQNDPPVLVSISPTEVNAGSALVTLTLSGNNFNATSTINFGSAQLSPLTANGTSMTVILPANVLVAGTYPVSVSNPAPGGGTTYPLLFTVKPQGSSAPTIISVNPASTPAGSGGTTVIVQGTGFTASTTATLGSVNGTVSGNSVTFALSAGDTQRPGTLSGLIANEGGSASFSVNILNGQPTVSEFNPEKAATGSPSVEITDNGTNFNTASQITIEGTPVPTQLVSSTQLRGTIPEAFMRRSGIVHIGVTNVPPG